jgi:hypothetical protein
MFEAAFSDPDGDTLEVSWYVDGSLSSSAGASAMALDLDYDSSGEHTVLAEARDPSGLAGNVTWRVVVANVDRPPVCGIGAPQGLAGPSGSALPFVANASDPDGTPASLRWWVNTTLRAHGAEFELTLPPGTAEVTLEVRSGALSASCSVLASGVLSPPPPPAPLQSPFAMWVAAPAIAAICTVGALLWVVRPRRRP